jgi:hypothetical protein
MTKVEYCSADVYFKTNEYYMGFMGHSSRALGKACGELRKAGLIEKITKTMKQGLWRTKFMDGKEK